MVVGPWMPSLFASSFILEDNSLFIKFLSVKPFVMCQLFPAGTLTNAVTLEKPKNVLKLAFTQEFVQFFWWHGLEGLICGSEDSVDPFPVECLHQPCRLDGGDQHAVGMHTENVTCLWGPACCGYAHRKCHLPVGAVIYLTTEGRWSPEHWDSPLCQAQKGTTMVCIFSPKC